jgi:hypothetical protein
LGATSWRIHPRNLQVEKLMGENVQKHGTVIAKTKPIAK